MVQFGSADEHEFRAALNSSGGLARIEAALNTIRAEHAQASVATDREYILAVVEREVGLASFNDFIRKGLKHEYTSISELAAFGGGGGLLASNFL